MDLEIMLQHVDESLGGLEWVIVDEKSRRLLTSYLSAQDCIAQGLKHGLISAVRYYHRGRMLAITAREGTYDVTEHDYATGDGDISVYKSAREAVEAAMEIVDEYRLGRPELEAAAA